MAGKAPRGKPVPLADLAGPLLDPVLRRRTGMSLALVQSWEEIVGPRFAGRSRPEKIAWPRRPGEDDPFEPATLVIACEGVAALHVQHETGEILSRVNAFLGFSAIGRIRIVQKPVTTGTPRRPPPPGPVPPEKRQWLASRIEGVEDEGLRAALERLGSSVLGQRQRR